MAYITQTDLENAIGPAAVLAIYDDDGDLALSSSELAALASVLDRSSAKVDGRLARSYDGPFPLSPVPKLVKYAALEYAIAYSFERHPEFVRAFGRDEHAIRLKRAEDMAEDIADAIEFLPDFAAQKTPGTAGGVVPNNGPQLLVDRLDGTSLTGDF
jgi:hypothetical protein